MPSSVSLPIGGAVDANLPHRAVAIVTQTWSIPYPFFQKKEHAASVLNVRAGTAFQDAFSSIGWVRPHAIMIATEFTGIWNSAMAMMLPLPVRYP
jgi:hypothetical protein